MQPTASSPIHRLFHKSERIILLFAVYGVVAGVVTVISTFSYEQDLFAVLSIIMNIPTGLAYFMILGEHYSIPVPIPVWNVFIVLGSVLVWTVIGFIVYCFYRLFKLGP
ncbi:MAG: hypothetical protein HRF40_00520 [Nitrososphaera sp.]